MRFFKESFFNFKFYTNITHKNNVEYFVVFFYLWYNLQCRDKFPNMQQIFSN